jgi:AcrR family transcriptional regulator
MSGRHNDLQARRRASRQDARRRLLETAHELVENRPWTTISLDEITSGASVPRTAFYRHFEDRQQLLVAMLDDVGVELEHVADNWMADAEDPLAEMRRSLSGLTTIFVEHGRLLQAISDAARTDPDIAAIYRALADRLVASTAQRIERDIAAGRSKIAEPREVARALTWMNERYLLASFGSRPFSDPEAVARALGEIWGNTLYGPASV